MKTYDLLLSFGCSFTEGGGLNDIRYHKFLKTSVSNLDEYMNTHSYPRYLGNLIGCELINFGKSSAGNKFIFRSVYDETKKYIESYKKILITVQLSILSRILLFSSSNDDEYNVNTHITQPNHIGNFYKAYLKYFFNEKKEFDELIRNVDLIQTWLNFKNIDFVFIAWDVPEDLPSNFFYKFNSLHGALGNYASENKLLISDIPDIPYKDYHLTEHGNYKIAELIFEHIKKTYD